MDATEFTLYWRTGEREIVKGPDVASAMTLAGYGGGSVRALDFWARGDDRDWQWNAEKREWNNKVRLELKAELAALPPRMDLGK